MTVEVYLTTEAREAMNGLPLPILRRVNQVLERLERWPEVSGVKPLTGPMVGWYRMRTGDYRVQFRVSGTKIIVARIGHRDGFYEG